MSSCSRHVDASLSFSVLRRVVLINSDLKREDLLAGSCAPGPEFAGWLVLVRAYPRGRIDSIGFHRHIANSVLASTPYQKEILKKVQSDSDQAKTHPEYAGTVCNLRS